MKIFLMLPLMLLAAIPLAADEPEQETAATSTARESSDDGTATATETTTTSATSTAIEHESPMVRAARRANRLGKKPKSVITNETVKNSKGHITTTTVKRPVDVPEPKMAPSEAAALKKRADEREKERVRVLGEEKAKKQEEETLRRRARAAERAEEGYLVDEQDDPARAERNADQDTSADAPPANTTSDEKPPQA